jgi:restriction system protein
MTMADDLTPCGARGLRCRFASLASRTLNWWRLRDHAGHRRRIAASRRLLHTLRGFTGEGVGGRVFAYLRTVDPLLYEETVLSTLEDAGAIVLRNLRYTGDGGIDGRCWLPGQGIRPLAIQCKRYGSAVAPKHVGEFCRAVADGRFAGGLFVHCGRTGPLSYDALRGRSVHLVSGQVMLNLMLRGHLPDLSRNRGGTRSDGSPLRPLDLSFGSPDRLLAWQQRPLSFKAAQIWNVAWAAATGSISASSAWRAMKHPHADVRQRAFAGRAAKGRPQ